MKVVILCGGLGTRLREETEFRPKPMVPIGGQPILWHIMKYYSCFGFKNFVLCLGYRGDYIKDYFRNYYWNNTDISIRLDDPRKLEVHNAHEDEDWTVTLLDTGLNTMTGGRVKRALEHIDGDEFLLTYGDGLTSHDIHETISTHREAGAAVTLTAVNSPGRFGELDIDGTRISSFAEKPAESANPISGGYFVCNKSVGDLIEGDETIFEREPLQTLAEQGKLHAYTYRGFWQCMDTFRESQMLEEMWASGKAPWKKW